MSTSDTSIDTCDLVFAQDPDKRDATPWVSEESTTQPPEKSPEEKLQDIRELVEELKAQPRHFGPEMSPEMYRARKAETQAKMEEDDIEEALYANRHFWDDKSVPQPPVDLKKKRSRSWMGTHQELDHETMRNLRCMAHVHKAEFITIFQETCPTTGKIHYHSLVVYPNPVRFATVAHLDPSAHWQTRNNGALGIYKYISKDGNHYFTWGETPDTIKAYQERQQKGTKKTQFQIIVDQIKAGNYAEIQEERVYAQYQRFFDQLAQSTEPSKRWQGQLQEKNHWLWGPPGSGKSSAVWDAAEAQGLTIYQKQQNKWWDGYHGENIVLIEDADPEIMKKLAAHMKVWADRYPFTYEVKGSSRTMKCPNYHMVVTSNYSIKECFNDRDAEAISRRFEEHFKDLPSVEEE